MGRFLTLLLGVAVVVVAGHFIRRAVLEDRQTWEGDWALRFDRLPDWYPPTFVGQIRSLENLPAEVGLRSLDARTRLCRALEANPWIEKVDRIQLNRGTIRFQAEFTRPVVALYGRGGFLLADSRGRIIDRQPGNRLHPAWGVPLYLPEQGAAPDLPGGTRLTGAEFDELFALLNVLWKDRVFDRFPGAIDEVLCEVLGEYDRVWALRLAQGTELVWGRSPASPRPCVLGVPEKLGHLRRVLEERDSLNGVPRVELWNPGGPLVRMP